MAPPYRSYVRAVRYRNDRKLTTADRDGFGGDDLRQRPGVIPAALFNDRLGPGAFGDGSEPVWHVHQLVPSIAACIHDGVVALPNAVAEKITTQKLPDILHRIELWAIGRQWQQADVLRDPQLGRSVPARAVEQEDGMSAGCDTTTDLSQVFVHRLDVHFRHHHGGAGGAVGADCTEQVCPVVTAIARRSRAGTSFRPDPRQRALLADTGFIGEPDLKRLVLRHRDGRLHALGELFLKSSCASGSL